MGGGETDGPILFAEQTIIDVSAWRFDLATMTFNENKWDQKKFKDVQKTMAFLCYDQKMHKNPDGSDKVYTVCYEDRFMGIIETDVWRFHEEMEIP